MAVRRSIGGRKRGFKAYSSAKQAGWDKPGGGGFPGDPFERTMKRVKLTPKLEPFGMDENRKQKMRRMLWYWQWSRDWNWRQIAAIANIQPDQQKGFSGDQAQQFEHAPSEISWYWRWPSKRKNNKRKRDLRKLSYNRDNGLIAWIVSLNPGKRDETVATS